MFLSFSTQCHRPPQRITQIKESSKSKNHKITTKTQHHPDQPTNPTTEIKNPPKSIKTIEIKTHRYQIAKPSHCRDPRSTHTVETTINPHCNPTTPSIASQPHPRPTNLRCIEKGKQRGEENKRKSGQRARERHNEKERRKNNKKW